MGPGDLQFARWENDGSEALLFNNGSATYQIFFQPEAPCVACYLPPVEPHAWHATCLP